MLLETLTMTNHKKMDAPALIERIHLFIQKHTLIAPHTKIIIGLSGGPDSIFLLHLLAELAPKNNLTLIAAHLDHEWRTNSWQDAALCTQVTSDLGIELIVKKRSALTGFNQKFNGSLEEQGRHLRRFFFEQLAQERNADCIALGHHLQDQQETFFIRLARGSSLTGLTIMQPNAHGYIRPLLETNKDELLAFLAEKQLPFATDSTNDADTFLRNRIRKQILPALDQCDARFNQNFLKTITRLQEAEQTLAQITQEHFERLSSYHDDARWIAIDQFFTLTTHLQDRILMHWLITHGITFPLSHRFLQEAKRFLKNGVSQTHTLCADIIVLKIKNRATIQRKIFLSPSD